MSRHRDPVRTRRPLAVPPPLVDRVEPGPDAIRAAFGAHMAAEHSSLVGRGCRTCRRYVSATVDARARAAGP